jgi:hypothetical protein
MPIRLVAAPTSSPVPERDDRSDHGGGDLHPYPYCALPAGPFCALPPEFDEARRMQSLLTIESFDGRRVMELARR